MNAHLDYILFVYGFAFVVAGHAAFTLQRTSEPVLPWRLLGLFGAAYGLNVWSQVVARAFGDPLALRILRLLLVAAAFLCLLEFARWSCRRLGVRTPGRWILVVVALLAALGGIAGLSGAEASARYALGLTGSLWAAYAVWKYRAAHFPGNPCLAVMSVSLGAFALLAGLIVDPASFEPARSLNSASFLEWARFPLQILRACAAFAAGAALWRHSRVIVRREHPGMDRRGSIARFGWVLVAILALVVAGGWVATELVGRGAEQELRDQLLDRTELAAAAVNPARVAALSATTADLASLDYQRLREQLALVTASTDDILWTYLMVAREGQILFAVDSIPEDDPDHAQPGELYLQPPPEIQAVLAGESKGAVAGPYTDAYGVFVSGFAPIRDLQTGRVVAAIGLDIEGGAWARRVATRRLIPIVTTLFIVLMVLGFWSAWDRLRNVDLRLADSERRFRAMADTALDAIVLIDQDGRVTFWNKAAEAMFGYSAVEILGKDLHSLVAPERYHPACERGLDAFRDTGTGPALGRTLEMAALRRDGSEFPVDLTVSALELDGTWHAVGVMRDATDRRRVLDELRETRDALDALIKAAPVGIVSLDLEERVKLWNPAAEQLTGWSADEVMGQPIPWVPDEAREESERIKSLWLSGGLVEGVELTRRRKDGSPLQVMFYSAPLHNAAGDMVGDMGLFMDIAERKQADEALKKAKADLEVANRQLELAVQRANQLAVEAQIANAAKSEFLANMSHEIRTPMNGVIGMTGLLLDTDLTPEQRDYAETISKSADSLLTVINDILDFSKIEAGKLELEELDFDLRTTLDDVAELLALRAHEKGLELAVLMDPEVPSCLRGDPGRLRQVLTNLIGNAVKFTEEGEVVLTVTTVQEEADSALLRFEVRDTGVGIAADQVERLFQPFTQADASTTRRYGGTGLGLTISKQLVEKMGGTIGVQSTPGQGSTFWFTARFIVRTPGPDEEQIPEPALESITGVRVLAVDDNRTNRKVVAGMLESWGCRHDEVENAEACLAALAQAADEGDPYRAVILDMVMPDCDGEMLGARIRSDSRLADVPLIMMTSMGSRGDAARLERAGFAAYLTKPVRQSQLYNCLTTVINQAARARTDKCDRPRLVTRHTLAEDRKRRIRILVAEDNPINQKVVLKTLEKMGFRADAVANGWEALRALEVIPYDLVLMDIQMPEMDGLEAAARIRDPKSRVKNHNIPIVALTAHAMAGDRQQALDAGMDDYLTKPVKPEELADVVGRLLGGEPTEPAPEDRKPAAACGQEEAVEPAADSAADAGLAVYDRNVLLGMLGGDEALATQIVEEFLRDADQQIAGIHDALGAGDFEQLKRAAHRLKGSAANVGAMGLRNGAVKLEAAAAAQNAAAAAALAASLTTALQVFRKEVSTGE